MINCLYGFPNININRIDFSEIKEIIQSGWVCIGKYVDQLEEMFRNRYKVKHAIASNNATNGLIIALKAAGWRNKRIAVPAFTWPSTVYAIECNQGNEPVFQDINRKTWMIEPDKRTNYDCILAVDTFGAENEINEVIYPHDDIPLNSYKPIIYDAAHGFDIPNLGHRGLVEVVSFSFTKTVTAMEGGMILTNNDEVADLAKELRRLSGRLEEINAYIAIKSIEEYDDAWKVKKNEIVQNYINGFDFNYELQSYKSTNHSVFAILFESTYTRNAVMTALSNNEVEYKVYYDPIVSGFKNTDEVYSKILALPVHKKMIEKQSEIIDIINNAVYKNRFTPGKNYLNNVLRKQS